ncbi:MAG: lamin tail domain-containing protein [Candidatus Bathyarchaeota archaeon]|nr:lamin tail domain-containing protein [Candidatus Bathyarchaeota archaeon]
MKTLTKTSAAILGAAFLFATFSTSGSAVSGASSTTVVVNEFMAINESTVQNDNGNYTDWIELYNTADYSIDLSDMFLTDNLTSYRWQFPNDTVIQAHGYLLVWADADVMLGGLHTNFKLDGDGETIGLYATDGSLMDSVTFGEQIADISYGRTVDGDSNWTYITDPTPGAANNSSSSLFTADTGIVLVIVAVGAFAVCIVVFKGKICGGRTQ